MATGIQELLRYAGTSQVPGALDCTDCRQSGVNASSLARMAARLRACWPGCGARRLAALATLCMCSVSPTRAGVAAASARSLSAGVPRPSALLAPAPGTRARSASLGSAPSAALTPTESTPESATLFACSGVSRALASARATCASVRARTGVVGHEAPSTSTTASRTCPGCAGPAAIPTLGASARARDGVVGPAAPSSPESSAGVVEPFTPSTLYASARARTGAALAPSLRQLQILVHARLSLS